MRVSYEDFRIKFYAHLKNENKTAYGQTDQFTNKKNGIGVRDAAQSEQPCLKKIIVLPIIVKVNF